MLLAGWLPGMSDQPSTWSDICLVIIKKIITTSDAIRVTFHPCTIALLISALIANLRCILLLALFLMPTLLNRIPDICNLLIFNNIDMKDINTF